MTLLQIENALTDAVNATEKAGQTEEQETFQDILDEIRGQGMADLDDLLELVNEYKGTVQAKLDSLELKASKEGTQCYETIERIEEVQEETKKIELVLKKAY